MQWKLFWVLVGSLLSGALAVVPSWLDLSRWYAFAAVAVVGAAAEFSCSHTIHRARMFAALKYERRDRIVHLTRMAIGAYIVWTILYLSVPSLWLGWLFGLTAVSIVVYCGSMAEEFLLHRPIPVKPESKAQQSNSVSSVGASSSDVELMPETSEDLTNAVAKAKFAQILLMTGNPRVKILGHNTVVDPEGSLVANQFLLQTPPTGR